MPQISLRISKNIDIAQVNFQPFFAAVHDALRDVPGVDIAACHSGVIQEVFSYVGHGDDRMTKMYLELYWLESAERVLIKKQIAQKLMTILEDIIVPQIKKQKLICIPRVRIANLGELGQSYQISQLTVQS